MSELVLRNRQRVRRVNARLIRRIVESVLEEGLAGGDYELGIHLVGAAEMARLNWQFLRHEGPTDVITFNHGEAGQVSRRSQGAKIGDGDGRDACATIHGEIFICLDAAVSQARQFRTNWQSELVRYVIHGLLHLLGYDDQRAGSRRKMKRREERLLRSAAGRFKIADLAVTRRHRKSQAISLSALP